MLQYSEITPLLIIPSEQNLKDANIVTVLGHIDHDSSSSFPNSSSNISTSDSAGSYVSKKDIYVCTFCQVFSPLQAAIIDHISTIHFESLPLGTKPENFVSKLQSLHGNPAKMKGRVGRPKKSKENSLAIAKPKVSPAEPTPGPDGLFWCKTCLRYFKKSRQLTQHICHDLEEQDECSDESSESEEGDAFRIHIDVDPVPWSRRKKHNSLKGNESSITVDSLPETNECTAGAKSKENSVDTFIPNWRNDPSYVPLFQDESEKAAFEEHLKSIDYSYVDTLFQAEEKRCRNNNKKNCVHVQSVIYSCNYCKKVLKSLSHIRLHCLTHTDFKPFTCPKCSYKTNSKGSLYMHMRIHTGNVFCCSVCDFKCIKRSHLLDHEATHSSIPQMCKLCKNSYKTQRTLIAHIRRYHNNPGGKKYIKSLTSKQSKEFKCDICKKKFKSLDVLTNHNRVCHENDINCHKLQPDPMNNHSEHNSENLNDTVEDMPIEHSPEDVRSKESLAAIVLNNFLQQEQSQSILYENVFHQTNENMLPEPSDDLLKSFQTKTVSDRFASESSILADCQKTLDILNECLQNADFSNECSQDFSLQSNLPSEHSLQNNTKNNSKNVGHLEEMSENKGEEPKPAEIKLFEKCQRAPAYVCCVCSAIYICPSTLKAHLKEHVNNPSSSLIVQSDEQFEATKMSEASNDLDVCEILQGATETCSYDEELEKLYTSSLDMMWYLPEVSVVLQNDPALFDSMLDDISNFTPDALDVRDADESVLKCFDEL